MPASETASRERRVFLWAAAAGALVVVAFIAWVNLDIGGDRVTTAVDDIGEAVAALIAAVSCGVAARRQGGRQRLGWALLAASAATWGAGEVVWAVYEIGMGVAVPYPSPADAGFLGAVPLAAMGILAFFSPPRGTSTRLRLYLDGTIVFLALFFIAWTLGLKAVYADTDVPLLEQFLNLAYPIGDLLLGTILVLAIRRAPDAAQGRLLLLLGGLAATSVADSAFSYLGVTGAYGSVGSVLDAGWVAGYLMIGLAALWPMGIKTRAVREDAIDFWQIVLPWLAVGCAGVTAIVVAFTEGSLGPVRTVIIGVLAILMMASQIYAHNESMSYLRKTRRYAATLNDVIVNAPLGIARIDADGRIIDANPRFASLLSMGRDEVVGKHLPLLAEELKPLLSGSIDSLESEGSVIRSVGSSTWIHWSSTVVRKADMTAVDYFIVMFEDMSARHDAEVAATTNFNVLERISRLKSEFLTMVSHEFRTALVGIQGFSELMQDPDELDIPTIKGFAADIHKDARSLDEMLDRMLDLDRIEADRVEVHLAPIDVGAAVREAVKRAAASDGNHSITVDIDPDLPQISADGARLAQVMNILLSNAVRYSPEGSEINVRGHSLPGRVVVDVVDHGAGMPPDFDDKLFARYQWSADNPTTKVMGTGLGLPMARQIVEMHGGRIWFESKLGAGSEFHFSVPLQANASAALGRVHPPAVASPG